MENPKDINTLIAEIDSSFGAGDDNFYTDGQPTPRFKDWIPKYSDITASEQTLPILREIYNACIYNVPMPENASAESYISKLEEKKRFQEQKIEDFKEKLKRGEVEEMHFNPGTGEIESIEGFQEVVDSIQKKIDIIKTNQLR